MYPESLVANVRNLHIAAVALSLCVIVSIFRIGARAQELGGAIKFDAFEDMKADDIQARLDLFAKQLEKDEGVSGFIVAYRREHQLPGFFLRNIYGYRDYLVNKRGIDPDRISIIDGGTGEERVTELWLTPKGTKPPGRAASLEVSAPMQFDSVSLGSGCVGEFTLELPEPSDALRFFAGALSGSATVNGYIVMHPSARESLNRAQKLARSTKELLVKEQGVEAQRIVTSLASRRHCQEIDFWLAPSSLLVPQGANIEFVAQSQLIAEAEQNRYTVRRVEFAGNEHTRDMELRRRIPGLQEGEIFRKEILRKNLASLSRLRTIRPVGFDDLEVHLNRNEQTIDLAIFINEQRRAR